MKIVVAMDKFKGSLTASQACDAVARGLGSVCSSGTEIVSMPMADGGDGTVAVLLAGRSDGEAVVERVMDPLGREMDAVYGWFPSTDWAVVEMARASGLNLLRSDELDPIRTSTRGTGQLMLAAIERGATKISLAIGGSATVDGGVGAAMAMGWKFLDAHGCPVGFGGGELERIEKIVPPDDRSAWPEIEVWCDVVNPLCGPTGAAQVFGPQKGATPAMVTRLDAGLRHLAQRVREQLGRDIDGVAGGGAAGGLAAGAIAFFGARLVSGIDAIMEATGFRDAARGADCVVTGEGQFDPQSFQGKVVTGVVNVARQQGARVVVLAGDCIGVEESRWRAAGIDEVIVVRPDGMTLGWAVQLAGALVEESARCWAMQRLCPLNG
jgi:glycerate kinase